MTNLIAHYGSWVVFALLCAESFGIPVPGETVLIAAAIYAGTTQQLNIAIVLGAAAAGAILGNLVGYWIGREYGYRLLLRYGPYLRLTESRIRIGQYLFLRYGSGVVFLARFLAVLRSVSALLAGANHMPLRGFVSASIAGGTAWVGVVGLSAYYFGQQTERLALPVTITLVGAAVLIIAGLVVILRREESNLAAEAERALPGPLQAA